MSLPSVEVVHVNPLISLTASHLCATWNDVLRRLHRTVLYYSIVHLQGLCQVTLACPRSTSQLVVLFLRLLLLYWLSCFAMFLLCTIDI
jgi:hypothetical protein